MPGVTAIVSGKGGVGKSTLTANLGACLATRGRNVCLIDLDMGLRSLDLLLGIENRVVFDLSDLAEGMCRVRQALVQHEELETLFVLNAAQTRGGDAVTPRQMEKLATKLRERFDDILIDCPAGIGQGFSAALAACDGALLVTNPESVALRDAERVAGLLNASGVASPLLIINRANWRDAARAEEFSERTGLRIAALIPEDRQIGKSVESGRPAFLAGAPSAPYFAHAADELLGEASARPEIARPGLIKRVVAAIRE